MIDRWPRLSEEQMDFHAEILKTHILGGFLQPKRHPSMLLLNLNELFSTREFIDKLTADYMNPPEFVSHAHTSLDAYAAAVLSSNVELPPGLLRLACCLERNPDESGLLLKMLCGQIADEEGRLLDANDEAMGQVLASFSVLFAMKGFAAQRLSNDTLLGLPLSFAYPGQMIAELSPCLRNRAEADWPVAFLTFEPTSRLRMLAKEVLVFAQTSPRNMPA